MEYIGYIVTSLGARTILTVLDGAMLILNYRELLAESTLLWQVLSCLGKYLVYLMICVAVLLMLRALVKMPRELWRKSLHIVAYTSALCMMIVSKDWLVSCLCCILFSVLVYPVLCLAERWKGYADFVVQRRDGEVKKSLWLLFLTHAALIALCWGWMDKPYIVFASVLAWGTGDTMAALVGKCFGKHRIHIPHADPKKTWEGSVAMAVTAFVFTAAVLLLMTEIPLVYCLLSALLTAPVAAAAELFSHNGNDTVSVPVAVAAVLSLLSLTPVLLC